jgi:predicted transcriptional regulator
MHGHPNGGPPLRLPHPGSLEYTTQRLVLLELVVDPPAGGDRFDELCETLGLADVDADEAVAALAVAGLVERRADAVRASQAARYFEHLWPVCP